MARSPKTADDAPSVPVEQAHFLPLLPWQRQHWQRMLGRWPSLPHAVLLAGGAGTGKRRFADRLAGWLLCEQRNNRLDGEGACGQCASCYWLRAGTHPSLLRISREIDSKGKQSKQLKIDQIRDLMPFVQQTGGVDGGWRVVIIEPAEALNIAAANALLKTLEEPAAHVLLLLVADQALQLPATIRSRVQQWPLGRIDSNQAIEFVTDEAHISASQAAQVLTLAGGAPLAAVNLVQHPRYLARSAWASDWLLLRQGRLDPISLSARWQKQLPLQEWLFLLQWMCRDALALLLGQPPIQTDLALERVLQGIAIDQVQQLSDQINQHVLAQAQNVQAALVYDSVMQQLADMRY